MVDPKSTKDAPETVSRFAKSGLEEARRGDLASISEGELASFEAVVRADGSRPTLLLRDGQVPLDHPMIGDWRDVRASSPRSAVRPNRRTCVNVATRRDPAPARKHVNSAVFAKSREISLECDCVVADAVVVEPVSPYDFPANREKYREFHEI